MVSFFFYLLFENAYPRETVVKLTTVRPQANLMLWNCQPDVFRKSVNCFPRKKKISLNVFKSFLNFYGLENCSATFLGLFTRLLNQKYWLVKKKNSSSIQISCRWFKKINLNNFCFVRRFVDLKKKSNICTPAKSAIYFKYSQFPFQNKKLFSLTGN